MIIIRQLVIERRTEFLLTDRNIVMLSAVSVFLPYVLSAIVLISLALYIIFDKHKRSLLFIHKNSSVLLPFFFITLIVPLLYQNWLGVVTGIGIILAFVLGLYFRSVMTSELFEKILHLICIMSITALSCAVTENLYHIFLNQGDDVNRVSAMFYYPNYYGTIISIVIIICAYKVLTNQGQRNFYILVAAANVIGIYLCKSMFVWVEVFLGVAVLFVLLKKHRLLAIWLFCAAFAIFSIFVLDLNIIPRLSEMEVTAMLRLKIWDTAIRAVKASPLVGHGFMSYLFLFDQYYHGRVIPHAHNILLELLMDIGVLGTAMLLIYFISFYRDVFRVCFKEKKTGITSIIIAVSAAAFVHGFADITLMWIQTLPLFFLILSGMGASEKK